MKWDHLESLRRFVQTKSTDFRLTCCSLDCQTTVTEFDCECCLTWTELYFVEIHQMTSMLNTHIHLRSVLFSTPYEPMRNCMLSRSQSILANALFVSHDKFIGIMRKKTYYRCRVVLGASPEMNRNKWNKMHSKRRPQQQQQSTTHIDLIRNASLWYIPWKISEVFRSTWNKNEESWIRPANRGKITLKVNFKSVHDLNELKPE